MLIYRKVAAASGDMKKALGVCRIALVSLKANGAIPMPRALICWIDTKAKIKFSRVCKQDHFYIGAGMKSALT
ncbi:hypothetical protein EJB05_12557 [Eragrostis curvula]|uniref:Uncharacterized protein n=1 Tax=Eragrostis curvula TaxID=38414 RepID=A0A5J9VRX3_9POAL|nr:hypothetical protein EJB05_12557 [Eragrostis curvula]